MPFGIASIEDNIVARLAVKIPEVKVEGFPEKPAEYQFLHPKGVLLVHYEGSKLNVSDGTDSLKQEIVMNFGVTVLTRGLRGNGGAYDFLDRVRSALVGFKIMGCGKIYQVDDGFDSEDGGKWNYHMAFALRTNFIEDNGV